MKEIDKETKERIVEIRLLLAKSVMLDAPLEVIRSIKDWGNSTEKAAKDATPSQEVGVGDAAKVELTNVN